MLIKYSIPSSRKNSPLNSNFVDGVQKSHSVICNISPMERETLQCTKDSSNTIETKIPSKHKSCVTAHEKRKYQPHLLKSTVAKRTNLLEQDFSTTTINEKWVAGITYIHTQKDGWCYLASVIDLYSKKII